MTTEFSRPRSLKPLFHLAAAVGMHQTCTRKSDLLSARELKSLDRQSRPVANKFQRSPRKIMVSALCLSGNLSSRCRSRRPSRPYAMLRWRHDENNSRSYQQASCQTRRRPGANPDLSILTRANLALEVVRPENWIQDVPASQVDHRRCPRGQALAFDCLLLRAAQMAVKIRRQRGGRIKQINQ